MYKAHVYCQSKNHKQKPKTNPEWAIIPEEEKEMSVGGEERVFIFYCV